MFKNNGKLKRRFQIFQHYLKLIKYSSIISKFLDTGIYFYSQGNISRKYKIFSFPLFIVSANDKKYYYKEAQVIFGGWSKKTVIIFDDIVVSIYGDEHYKTYFDSIGKYITICNYSKCEYLELNYKKRYNICSKIEGYHLEKIFTDIYHVAKLILMKNLAAEKSNINIKQSILQELGICDAVFLVQHGDLDSCNILKSDSGYFVIDFDTIDSLPLLNDFLRLILSVDDGLIFFYNGYFDSEINLLLCDCEKGGILEFKDKYLAIFCVYNLIWVDRICDKEVPSEYKLTNEVIRKISLLKQR